MEETDTTHLTAGQVAGYFDNRLEASERAMVERHLDECPECRGDLAELTRLELSAVPTGSLPRRLVALGRRWVVPVALAAGLGAVALLRPWNDFNRRVEREGSGPSESVVRIQAEAPLDGATLPGRDLTFLWHARAAGTYRITVMTERGEPVWSLETSDTIAKLPPTVALAPGASYFWRVEAIADGVVATSIARRLTVAP